MTGALWLVGPARARPEPSWASEDLDLAITCSHFRGYTRGRQRTRESFLLMLVTLSVLLSALRLFTYLQYQSETGQSDAIIPL